MDTAFAKIVTGPDGSDCIMIEGQIIQLLAGGREAEFVKAIVTGLRSQQRVSMVGGESAIAVKSTGEVVNL